ncbi:MAG: hypothetical protein QW575_08105 [Thermoproteota archaeon]
MWCGKATFLLFFFMVTSFFLVAYAGVYSFYSSQVLLRLNEPPVYYVSSNATYVNNIVLSYRMGVNYTDFEAVPGWNVLGGSWSWPVQGFSGKGYGGSGNPAISVMSTTLSSSETWFVSSKVFVPSNDGIYRGIVLYESSGRFFLLAIYGLSRLVILEFRNNWRTLSSVAINVQAGWYILNSTYTPSSGSIFLEVYDASGNRIASTSASSSRVSPVMAGVGVRGGSGSFDDFIISYARNGVVTVSGLASGWTAILYDSSGVVASSVAGSSGVVELNVRVKPIVRNATIVIKDQLNNVIASQFYVHVVGGDGLVLHRYNMMPYSILGENRTSFSCKINATRALHVFDYDLSGYSVAYRWLNYSLGTNNYVSIKAFVHVFNLTDPLSQGVVLLEVEAKNGTQVTYFSFYYYGGNQVHAGSYQVSLDINIPHFYAITLYMNGSKLKVSYYVDGVRVNSEAYNVGVLTVSGFAAGRYATSNMYDMYLDMVSAEFGTQSMQPLYEDFDSGVDNFFINSYSSGDAGKNVVYYTFPIRFLEGYFSGSISYLMSCTVVSSSVSGQPSASLWLYNGLEHSTQVKIVKGVIVYTSTSDLLVDKYRQVFFYFNGTFPSYSNVELKLEFFYKIGEGVRVAYPLDVESGV